MIDIITTALGNVLGEVLVAVVGVIVTGATGILSIYMKRMTTNLHRKMMLDEITRYVDFAEKAKSFTQMTFDEKVETILEKAKSFSEENGMKISDRELLIMIESSMGSLEQLKTIGARVLKMSRTFTQGDE